MSTQWNQQLGWFVFSKVIECLEQSIRKQIDCKRINIEYQIQMNWVQNIQTEMRKYKLSNVLKHNQVKLVLAVFVSS